MNDLNIKIQYIASMKPMSELETIDISIDALEKEVK